MDKDRQAAAFREDIHTSQTPSLADLRAAHTALEKRLAELDRHRSLTSEEQVERVRIKKEKLRLKDLMVSLGGPA